MAGCPETQSHPATDASHDAAVVERVQTAMPEHTAGTCWPHRRLCGTNHSLAGMTGYFAAITDI